ncbi:MAG TPA: hypothetical protein VH476_04530 [Solirubrobacterales bacterium]
MSGWTNSPPSPAGFNSVGFYKDREGIVHLQGLAIGGEVGKPVFVLPPGFRPGAAKVVAASAVCGCSGGNSTWPLFILGSSVPAVEGAVFIPTASTVGLDGVTFRAES